MHSSISAIFLWANLVRAAAFSNSSSSSTTSFVSATTTSPAPTSTGSCLYPSNPGIGYTGDDSDFDCNRPGDPQLMIGGYNIYAYEASWDPVMSSSCSRVYESALDSWKATAAITTYAITGLDEENQPDQTQTYVQFDNNYSWTPTRGSGCCLNCSLYGGTVQVYYWPTPAPTPAVSTLVNDIGFSFISPSIYVAFQSLYATDLCGDVGPTYTSTTLAFKPDELMTAPAWTWNGSSPAPPNVPNVYSQANWGYEQNCTNHTSYFLQNELNGETYSDYAAAPETCKTGGGCFLDGYTITWNPCSPTLSVPTQLFTMNSLWTGCMQGIDAFYDPPYTLTAGNGLLEPTTTIVASYVTPGAQTTSAQPASSPVSPAATLTTSTTTALKTTSTSSSAAVDPKTSTSTAIDPAPTTSTTSTNSAVDPGTTSTSTQVVPGTTSTQPSPVNNPTTIIIGTQTLTPGGPAATVSGTTYSVPSSATAIIVNGQTSALPSASPSPAPATIGTHTIAPGSVATISGTTYSVPSTGTSNIIIVNGQTSSLPSPTTASISDYIIASQTLLPGGPALTISGTTYSLPVSAPSVIINGVTQSFIAPGSSTYIIGSQTLVAGKPGITVGGTVVSLMSGGSSVVVGGTTTEAVAGFVQATGTSSGLGGVIASLGGFLEPSTAVVTTTGVVGGGGNGTAAYTGGSGRVGGERELWRSVGVGCILWIGVLGVWWL